MASNCQELISANVQIPSGETATVFELGLQEYKSIKGIVTLKDEVNSLVQAYEISASYTLANPPAPLHTTYAVLGDDIDHTITFTYDTINEKFVFEVTNNTLDEISYTYAEVERIE